MTDADRELPGRLTAALVFGFAAYHLVAFVALHALVPALDPASSIITDYLDGPYPSLARSTFAAFALMWAGVAAGLWRALPRRPLCTAGIVLISVGIATLAIVTFVPPAADPRNAAHIGALGRFVGVGRGALFASLPVLSFAVRREPEWRRVGTLLLSLAIASVVLLAITLAWLLERGYAGVTQRIVFVLMYAWACVAAGSVIESSP